MLLSKGNHAYTIDTTNRLNEGSYCVGNPLDEQQMRVLANSRIRVWRVLDIVITDVLRTVRCPASVL